MSRYPSINTQLTEFKTYCLFRGELEQINITNTCQYSHYLYDLHHFVKEQQYYKNPVKYKNLQKLILLPKKIHQDLHSAMSDDRFFEKWNILKSILIYKE